MQFHNVIKEVFINFTQNRWHSALYLFIIPFVFSLICLYLLGINFIVNEKFATMTISILLVFLGFYITLLIFINSRIVNLNIVDVNDTDIQSDYLRYIDFSRKITTTLIYSILCIFLVVIILLITFLNLYTDIKLVETIINFVGSLIVFFSLISFIVLLLKIVRYLSTDFLADLIRKRNNINKIRF